jgi:hypothetical protein
MYPGGGKAHLRDSEDYNQLKTYRIIGELVEKYGMDKGHPAIEKAANYLFSRQTNEGDFREYMAPNTRQTIHLP